MENTRHSSDGFSPKGSAEAAKNTVFRSTATKAPACVRTVEAGQLEYVVAVGQENLDDAGQPRIGGMVHGLAA
jgi:hypothetical protein